MPEQIINSDGVTKQNCEMNAAKRFIGNIRKEFPQRIAVRLDGPQIKVL